MAVQDESGRVEAAGMASHSRVIRWLRWLPWTLLLLGMFAQITDPGKVISTLRFQLFDFYQRQSPRPYVDTATVTGVGVRYLDIDNESLKRVGQWPWSRKKLGELVDKVREMGAAVIVFDMVFAEPDRTSPALLLPELPQESTDEWSQTRALLAGLKSHGIILAEALTRMPAVAGFILTGGALERPPALKVNPANVGEDKAINYVANFTGATLNLSQIEAAAAGNGSFNTLADSDGIIRRVPIVLGLGEQSVPSTAAEAIRILSGRRSIVVKMPGASDEVNWGDTTGIAKIQVGKTLVDPTKDGQIWIHFTPVHKDRRISAYKIFEPGEDADDVAKKIKGSVVFLGTSAEGLRDIRATPIDPAMPGVEVQAMAVEQMLLGHYLTRPDYALGMEITFSLFIGIAVLLMIRRISPYWIALVAFGAIGIAVAYSWYQYLEFRALFDPLGPGSVVALIFASGGLVRFMETEVERRTVRSAFAHYLPPGVVEEIARDPSKLKLGGATRTLTVMFCDIRGFTSVAESFRTDPQSLTRLINRVLTPLSQSVLDSRGTIDKYIGDCIMAFWNAPLDDKDHARHACECVLEMQQKLNALNAELDAEGFYKTHNVKRIAVGVGLNSGACVVGNMGSDQRFDYSALGDAVNLAARFQTLSSNYGSFIVVGEDTVSTIRDDFAFMEIDYVIVKGRAIPTHLYALMGPPSAKENPAYQALDAALQALFAAIRAKDWAGAREKLAAGRALPGVDQTIFDTYAHRIDLWSTADLPQNWDGSWSALEK